MDDELAGVQAGIANMAKNTGKNNFFFLGGKHINYIVQKIVDNTNEQDDEDGPKASPPKPKPAVAPVKKSIEQTNTTIITGIIGTDSEGNTYSPQKLTFTFNKDNKDANIIKAIIDKNVDEWNSIEGCQCNSFAIEMPCDGLPITVISGHDHGFMIKVLPVPGKNVGAAKGAGAPKPPGSDKKKGVKKDDNV